MSEVFFARNMQELFYHNKTVANLAITGGMSAIRVVGGKIPEKYISTSQIEDLSRFQKHERHIDFGPGVTLSRILKLGEHHIPDVLFNAICDVANPFVRNIATIGGNIASPTKMSLFAPLMALDTQLEFQNMMNTLYIPLQKFSLIPKGYILTNIKVPLNDWNISIYKRLGPRRTITGDSASFAFLVASEKSSILNIRACFSGKVTFRCTSLENKLMGVRLPIKQDMIEMGISDALATFDAEAEGANASAMLRKEFEHLIEYSLEQLT